MGYRVVHQGDPLTRREQRVIDLMSQGLYMREVAAKLDGTEWVTEDVVKMDLKYIRRKLGAKNTAHAVRLAIKDGWITP